MMKPFGVVLICSSFAAFTAYGAALELDGVCARLAFDGGGRVVSVFEKESGRELASVPFPFVTVKRSGERVLEPVSLAVAPDGARRLLTFGFPGGLGECVVSMKGFGGGVGYMLDISRDKVPTMDTLKTMVDVLAATGFSEFQLYTEHTFAYAAHAEVWKDWSPMTAAEIRDLDDYAWLRACCSCGAGCLRRDCRQDRFGKTG